MTFPPDPTDVVATLKPFTDFALVALDAGLEHANWYEEATGFESDPQLFAYLVRNSVRNELIRSAGAVPLGLTVRPLALCGIEALNDDYRIRLLKASYKTNEDSAQREVAVPGARQSLARRQFFWQMPMRFQQPTLALDVRRVLKLVLLWDCDSSGGLSHVSLALTKRWDEDMNVVQLYWRVPIYPTGDAVSFDVDVAVDGLDGDEPSLPDFVLPRKQDEEEATEGT